MIEIRCSRSPPSSSRCAGTPSLELLNHRDDNNRSRILALPFTPWQSGICTPLRLSPDPLEPLMADPLDKSSDADRSPHPLESGDGVPAAMNAWRIKTLNTVLTVAAALGLVSLVSFLISEARTPGQLSATLSFFAAYVILLILAFQRRWPWRIRGWGFLLIAYVVGMIGLARGGLAGAGREYLIITPVRAVLLIGARAGMATAALSLLIMIAFAFAVDAGFFRGMLIYSQNPVDLASWLQEVAYTAVGMGVGTALLILFNRYLLAMLEAEHKTGQKLAAAHAQLE